MKLVIDVEKDYYEMLKYNVEHGKKYKPFEIIANGTPYNPKGEWIGDTDFDNTCKCSKCRMTFDTDRLKMVMCDGKYELPPCCPNCGAGMKSEVEVE